MSANSFKANECKIVGFVSNYEEAGFVRECEGFQFIIRCPM